MVDALSLGNVSNEGIHTAGALHSVRAMTMIEDTSTLSPNCPECDAALTLSGPRVSEIVECDECRAELEVMSTQPLVVALAPEVEEDWGE